MASQPIDQGAILASGRAVVPDYAAQVIQQALLRVQQQQAEAQGLSAQTAASHENRAAQQQAAYQAAIANLPANPTAGDFARLIVQHPQFSEALKQGYQTLDESARRADFQSLAEINSAARGGNYQLAARLMRQRDEADAAAGHPADPLHAAILAGLNSQNPDEQHNARDLLERTTAAIAGPDHYASVFGTFQRRTAVINDVLVDLDTGRAISQDPRGQIIPGSQGAFQQNQPIPGVPTFDGSTAPPYSEGSSSGAGVPPVAPEGQPAPSSGGQNNPGGLRIPGTTRFQSFSTPAAGIAAQEALLRESYLNRPTTVRDIVERYAPRRSRGGDNTDAQVNNYIAYVARRLGVTPTARIDGAVVLPLAQAMREFETGRRRRGAIASNAGQPVRVRSRQEYAALPAGTEYIDPNGRHRTKQ